MACNVGQYLPCDDSPVPDVEDIVHARDMIAYPKRVGSRRRRRGFYPPRSMEVEISTSGERLVLTAYINKAGYAYVDLHRHDTILRKLHTHDNHWNPGGQLVEGAHMHFPTRRYPLSTGRSSYAYPIEAEVDVVSEGVLYLCQHLDINVLAIQPLLGE